MCVCVCVCVCSVPFCNCTLSCADAEGIICVQLLAELLCNRATKRLKKVLYHFQVWKCHVVPLCNLLHFFREVKT